jgi:hypothetical protein
LLKKGVPYLRYNYDCYSVWKIRRARAEEVERVEEGESNINTGEQQYLTPSATSSRFGRPPWSDHLKFNTN